MSEEDFGGEQLEFFEDVPPEVLEEELAEADELTTQPDLFLSGFVLTLNAFGDITLTLKELGSGIEGALDGPEWVKKNFATEWPSFEHTQEVVDLMRKMQDYYESMLSDIKYVFPQKKG